VAVEVELGVALAVLCAAVAEGVGVMVRVAVGVAELVGVRLGVLVDVGVPATGMSPYLMPRPSAEK
jgi:hypothetical protein